MEQKKTAMLSIKGARIRRHFVHLFYTAVLLFSSSSFPSSFSIADELASLGEPSLSKVRATLLTGMYVREPCNPDLSPGLPEARQRL